MCTRTRPRYLHRHAHHSLITTSSFHGFRFSNPNDAIHTHEAPPLSKASPFGGWGVGKGGECGDGGRGGGGGKWGQCKIKLITSNYATDLIGERDSVRSLSSPIIRPVRDPSDARLIRRTLMKLAKQLLFLDSWVRSVAGVGSVCVSMWCACVWFVGKEETRSVRHHGGRMEIVVES